MPKAGLIIIMPLLIIMPKAGLIIIMPLLMPKAGTTNNNATESGGPTGWPGPWKNEE